MNRKAAKHFLILHGIAAGAALLFPLYMWIAKLLSAVFPGCAMHDFLFLYCPLCGGTRAVSHLLHFEFVAAVRANAFVVFAAAVALVFYILAWVRLFKGRERLFRIPGWLWVGLVVLMFLFGVLRNVLMVKWGIDPLGDLAAVWHK